MNKIININLAGRLIPIDESAYDQLRDYLNRLKAFFAREKGGDEIVRDMEDRMGELFQDQLKKGSPCIMSEDISRMIAIMGSPEQIESEAGEEESTTEKKADPQSDNGFHFFKSGKSHLSRSRKEKMIGGVCGGLAAHFNIDPTIIRIAFALVSIAWGAGFVVYLLLWALLPEMDTQEPAIKRRMYRDPKHKVVAGVCSGIAAYTNIDPIIPRVIFAAPLLGMIFFKILDHGLFVFPFLAGSLPTLALLYIVLWVSLPEANTVAEKLEMRGEKVDIHNLTNAIKGSDTVEKKRNGVGEIISILIKIFAFFFLGSIILFLAGVIVFVFAAMFGLATSSFLLIPLTDLITDNGMYRFLLWTCIILTLVIPFIAIIKLLVRIISGRKKNSSRWFSYSLAALFILSVFGLFWIGTAIATDFSSSYTKTYTLPITQPYNDTLIIRQSVIDDNGIVGDKDWDRDNFSNNDEGINGLRFRDDSTIAISNSNLHFTNSPDSMFHLLIQKTSKGRTNQKAKALAEALAFNFKQEGNVLTIPRDFTLPKGQPFRGQKQSIEIQVPVGKVFKTDGLDRDIFSNRFFSINHGNFSYTSTDNDDWEDGKYYKMVKDGIEHTDSTRNNTHEDDSQNEY